MTTPFPLFKLPLLPFEKVYQNFDIAEIIHLSQCSFRSANFLQSLIPSESQQQVKIEVNVEKNLGRVTLEPGEVKEYSWNLSMDQEDLSDDSRQFIDRPMNGTTWRVCHCEYASLSVHPPGSFEGDLLYVVRMIRNLFRCTIDKFFIEFSENVDFQKLIVASETLRSAETIRMSKEKFSHAEMRFMLNKFTADEFILNGVVAKKFRYAGVWNFKRIRVNNASWVDVKMLKKMTATSEQVIVSKNMAMLPVQYQAFVNEWTSDENHEHSDLDNFVLFKAEKKRRPQVPQVPDVPNVPNA